MEDRSGYVYVLKAQKPFEAVYKIGRTADPRKRLREFGVRLPYRVEPVVITKTENCHIAERCLHSLFAHRRIDGEWFALSDNDVNWIKWCGLVIECQELITRLYAAPPDLDCEPAVFLANIDRMEQHTRVLRMAALRFRRRFQGLSKYPNPEPPSSR